MRLKVLAVLVAAPVAGCLPLDDPPADGRAAAVVAVAEGESLGGVNPWDGPLPLVDPVEPFQPAPGPQPSPEPFPDDGPDIYRQTPSGDSGASEEPTAGGRPAAPKSRAVQWVSPPQARTSPLPVLIHFRRAVCEPCDRMERTTLSDPAVLAALEGFACVRVVDWHPELSTRFAVEQFPTDVVITRQGARRAVGYKTPTEFLAFLNANGETK